MRVPQHHFSLADVTNLLSPVVNQGVNTLQSAQGTITSIQKDVDFLNAYWPEIVIGIFIAMVMAGILSNAING